MIQAGPTTILLQSPTDFAKCRLKSCTAAVPIALASKGDACEPCMPHQNRRPFARFHLRITSASSGNIWKSLSHASVGSRPQLDCGWGSELESDITTPGPTQSFLFIKFGFFLHRGFRAVDIEVYRLYSCVWGGGVYVAQLPQQRKQETEIEVQDWRTIFILIRRLVGSVGYERSINKTKWQLLALPEAVRLWAAWWGKKCTEREFGKSRFY